MKPTSTSFYLWIALGGGLGGLARYGAKAGITELLGASLPYGTLTVNVAGSFAIGWFAALSVPEGRRLIAPEHRQFFMAGVCGGFTTFSFFSLETIELAQEGAVLLSVAYVVATLVLCLVSVFLGYRIGAK